MPERAQRRGPMLVCRLGIVTRGLSRKEVRAMIEIEVANEQSALEIDPEWLVTLARHVLLAEGVDQASISVALVDNATIHRLNRQFLEHDYPTDVITFPLSEEDEPLTGEIVLSTEYACSEAEEYQWSPRQEAALYLVHGLLHLCGYDDAEEEDRRMMHRRQEQLLHDFMDQTGSAEAKE